MLYGPKLVNALGHGCSGHYHDGGIVFILQLLIDKAFLTKGEAFCKVQYGLQISKPIVIVVTYSMLPASIFISSWRSQLMWVGTTTKRVDSLITSSLFDCSCSKTQTF